MTSFTVRNQVSKKACTNLILRLSYQKPLMLLLLAAGLLMASYIIFHFMGVGIAATLESPSMLQIIFGVALLISPLLVVLQAKKSYSTQPRLHNPIAYTFTPTEVITEGKDFSGRTSWNNFTKRKEIGSFMLLFVSNTAAEILDKSNFTEEQLQFIRSMVKATR